MTRIACGMGMAVLLVTLGMWATPGQKLPIASRYNLRQRTTQFFERASTPAAPCVKPAPTSEPVRISKAKQLQNA